MPEQNLSELTRFLAANIVSEPGAIEVDEVEEDGAVVVKVQVASKDVGRLIGRKGRTIDAVRNLVDMAASADGRQATVEVVEPEDER